MRVGIMGGTFDPIHTGHLIAGECAREEAMLDEVWFMPSNIPPHKENAPAANTGHRWDMVCLAVKDNAAFMPMDLELRDGGVSYSIDTVLKLQRMHPNIHFSYIIGADMVQYLPNWHRIDELVNLISFIGLERPGTTIQWEQLASNIQASVSMVEMPQLDISSTRIRELRSIGRSIRYLVPEAVNEYIRGEKLYE